MTDRKGELVGGKPARTERDIDVAGELLRESNGPPCSNRGPPDDLPLAVPQPRATVIQIAFVPGRMLY